MDKFNQFKVQNHMEMLTTGHSTPRNKKYNKNIVTVPSKHILDIDVGNMKRAMTSMNTRRKKVTNSIVIITE